MITFYLTAFEGRFFLYQWVNQDLEWLTDLPKIIQSGDSIPGLGTKGHALSIPSPCLSPLQRGISQAAIGFLLSTFDFQMFPLGSSQEHTCPLINGLGLHSPEFDQQGVFLLRMFLIFELAEEPKSSSGREGL